MTTDKAVSSTLGEMMDDLKTKAGGATGWSIAEDNVSGGSMSQGEDFTLQANTGEYVQFLMDPDSLNKFEIVIRYGPDYDTGTSSWNDEYNHSPSMSGDYHEGNGGSPKASFGPVDPNNSGPSEGDPATYWMSYDTSGFVFFSERAAGDGSDAVMSFGFVEVSRLWDYTTAAAREAEMAFICYSPVNMEYGNGTHIGNAGSSKVVSDAAFMCAGGRSEANVARGRPNGDSNFGNYPIVEKNAVRSSQYGGTIIGTHTRTFEPDAATDGDTVEDSNGNELYMILDKNLNAGVRSLGFRSDV